MKNYQKLIAGSLLTAMVMMSPAVSFAKENEKENGRNNEKKEEKNNKGSWFGSNWFHSKNAKKIVNTPIVSDLTITSTKNRKATIKWNTDLRSNSLVWYSTTPSIDTTKTPTIKRNDRVLKHKFEINKLQPNTKYYVVVGSSSNGGVGKSAEMSFTTSAITSSSSTPIITSATGTPTVKVGENATFTINASDPQNKALTYSVNWGDGQTVESIAFNQKVSLSHSYSSKGTYIVKFTITNSDGKKTTYPMQVKVTAIVTPDTTAPTISGIITNIAGTAATVSWTTNEQTTGTVFYGTNASIDTNSASTLKVTDAALTTNHSLSIPSLTSNTLYHFVIKSVDASNNGTLSSEATFTTGN